jgi:hypothetical protein
LFCHLRLRCSNGFRQRRWRYATVGYANFVAAMPIEDALVGVGASGQVPWQDGNILDCWQLTNRWRTVSALIGRWCVPTVCRAVSVALVNRFRKCWRTINLFWRAVVTCGLPQRGRSFVLFLAL